MPIRSFDATGVRTECCARSARRPRWDCGQKNLSLPAPHPCRYHAVRNVRGNLKVAADGVHLADFPLYIEAHYKVSSARRWHANMPGCCFRRAVLRCKGHASAALG